MNAEERAIRSARFELALRYAVRGKLKFTLLQLFALLNGGRAAA